ncbi:LANO_0G09472g1_1 [Lachancea nothofagi CBS 11611]|uniref:LANO_0G09472g1_1 n=1 Tax=Lachancea nothofagi CBS 11611 TaxID=1266666 RepID=A0A1G4KIL0_9SACH|nr:LANO_0G09472g1_1 [Lachancea nothofagi CBS 11611]
MYDLLLQKLKERDVVEKNFAELFEAAPIQNAKSDQGTQNQSKSLRKELEFRDKKIEEFNATLKLKNKDAERLNDEIITLNIENNLLQDQYDKMKSEYDGIVSRWLRKTQQEADTMNESFK